LSKLSDLACFVIYETSSIEQPKDNINKPKVERKLGVVNKVSECLQTPVRFQEKYFYFSYKSNSSVEKCLVVFISFND